MTERNVTLYLKDILEAMEAIERFVKDIDFEENNDLISSAVIRKFEIIGETTGNIPQGLERNIPIYP